MRVEGTAVAACGAATAGPVVRVRAASASGRPANHPGGWNGPAVATAGGSADVSP
jgi:hypothetical protein